MSITCILRCCEKRQIRRATMKELTRYPFINHNLASREDLAEFVRDTKEHYGSSSDQGEN